MERHEINRYGESAGERYGKWREGYDPEALCRVVRHFMEALDSMVTERL